MEIKPLILLLVLHSVYCFDAPRITQRGDLDQAHRVGRTVRLQCPIESRPPPYFEWRKGDEVIDFAWERIRVSDNVLRIKDADTEDTGIYVCKGTNGYGSVEVMFRIYIIPNDSMATPPTNFDVAFSTPAQDGEAPRFEADQQANRDLTKPAGSNIRLKCKAVGDPPLQYKWYKDGSLLPRLPTSEGDEDDPSTYKLFSAQETDSGAYTCKVNNKYGSINFTYNVEIIGLAHKPRITDDHPLNLTKYYGESATFQCRIVSQVEPNIQWLKRVDSDYDLRNRNNTIRVGGENFVILQESKVLPRNDGSYLNKLMIYGVKEHDSGQYICLGNNKMGYTYRSAYLTVLPYNPDNVHLNTEDSSLSSLEMALAIILPSIVVIIIIGVCIFLCQKRNKSSGKQPSAPRQTRAPPDGHFHQTQNGTGNQEKTYPHPYAPVPMQAPNQMNPYYNYMAPAPSREAIVTNYQQEHHSDHSNSSKSKSTPASSQHQMPLYTQHPPQQHAHYTYKNI